MSSPQFFAFSLLPNRLCPVIQTPLVLSFYFRYLQLFDVFLYILVYAKKCHSLRVKEDKMSKGARCDWGRIIRNKCTTVEGRLKQRLKKE